MIRRKRRIPPFSHSVDGGSVAIRKSRVIDPKDEDQNTPSDSSQETMDACVSVVLHRSIVIT